MSNPNIIYIYGDDLGRGMLSCYGQKHFQTPNIDRLAREGLQFTRAYGCIFCAPARASLMTGYHDAHAGRWTFTRGGLYRPLAEGTMTFEHIAELINNTGLQERPDEVFLAQIAQRAGYVTGQIGKLEWGFATTPERIRRHGWDYHYGYYDHQLCHGFYPPFLFENGDIVEIPGNTHPDCGNHPGSESPENAAIRHDMTGKVTYSQDLFNDKIVDFLRKHRNQPFFLFHPSQLPHGPISVPEIHPGVKDAPELTGFEKEYASMILRLDDTVGIILDELDALGIADNTIVFFSSDNGHEIYAAQQGRTVKRQSLDGIRYDDITTRHTTEQSGDIFNGNDGMAGLKWTSWGRRHPPSLHRALARSHLPRYNRSHDRQLRFYAHDIRSHRRRNTRLERRRILLAHPPGQRATPPRTRRLFIAPGSRPHHSRRLEIAPHQQNQQLPTLQHPIRLPGRKRPRCRISRQSRSTRTPTPQSLRRQLCPRQPRYASGVHPFREDT